MRINLRLKIRDLTFFMMISKTQTLRGLNSLVERNDDITKSRHLLLWDIEDCSLTECIRELKRIKKKYHINRKIYVMSDKARSFHAFSSYVTDFKTYLKILLDTQHLDFWFFLFVTRLYRGTIRLTPKIDRDKPRIIAIIKNRSDQPDTLPETVETRIYDTGHVKRGYTFEKEVLTR